MLDPARAAALSKGVLSIANEQLDDAALSALLERAPHLSEALLHGNRLSSAGVTGLLQNPASLALVSLDLSSNPIGDPGLLQVAAEGPASLRSVFLSDVGGTYRGIAAVANAPALRGVVFWSLGEQGVGNAGAQALVGLAASDTLLLQNAGVQGAGAAALIAGTQTRALVLDGNELGGLPVVAAMPPGLASLSCARCGLGGSLSKLTGASAPGLRHVNFSDNGLTDSDIDALIEATWLPQLKVLEIQATMGSAGAQRRLKQAWGERPGLLLN